MLTKKNDWYTLSFIMDDNNKEIINFKNIDEIDSICDKLIEKYNFDSNKKEELKEKIILEIQKEKENRKLNYNNEKDVTKRLYDLDIKERQDQALKNEIIHKENLEKEYKKYSFAPKIENQNKRNNKLNYYEKDKKNKENIQIQRILKFAKEMDECKQFKSNNNSIKNLKIEEEKISNNNKINNKGKNINKKIENSIRNLLENENNRKKIKEEKNNKIYKKECPFIPKINDISKFICENNPNREKDFSNRLYEKKQIKIIKSHSNSFFNLSKGNYKNNYYNFKHSNSNFFGLKLKKAEEELNKIKESNNLNKEKIHNLSMKNCQKYLNNYRLKHFKDIYEKLEKCENYDECLKMEKYGIDLELKNKLVLPVLHILKARNMEFNFQNFYILCNELLNYLGQEKK